MITVDGLSPFPATTVTWSVAEERVGGWGKMGFVFEPDPVNFLAIKNSLKSPFFVRFLTIFLIILEWESDSQDWLEKRLTFLKPKNCVFIFSKDS